MIAITLPLAALSGCGEQQDAEQGEVGRAQAELTRSDAPAAPGDEAERLQRLEARLLATERRLEEAERRAISAEARTRAALAGDSKGPVAPNLADPTVETRTEAEIKEAATGIDDGAAGPLPVPEEPAYDERNDPYKAEAFNVDPDPDD